MRKMKKGRLFVFEGLDGSGKTTQAVRLRDHFLQDGEDVHLFREPGATAVGEMIRKILLTQNDPDTGIDPLAEFLLFAASRRELTRQEIQPELANASVVILDRFGDSSVAYQGYGRGVDLDFIHEVNLKATYGIQPDMVFLLDMEVSSSLARIDRATDRMERSGVEFFQEVRNGYLEIARLNPERYSIIDASRTPEEVFESVKSLITKRFLRT